MIDHPIKLLLVLIALLVCPGVAATDNCDDPLGGGAGCQNQDLNSNDGAPGGNECGGNIVVASATSNGAVLSVNLSNPSTLAEQGFVVVTVLLGGRQYGYVFPVSVAARSGLSIAVTFPGTITTIGVQVCSNRPGGINEGPDVVAIRQEQDEPAN